MGRAKPRWTQHEIVVEPLEASPTGRQRLKELLLAATGRVDIGQQLDLADLRLREAIEAIPSSGSRTEANGICRRIAALAKRLVELGRIDHLGEDVAVALIRHSWVVEQARPVAVALLDEDWRAAAALLMLLDEVAGAHQVCRQHAPADEADQLCPQLVRLIQNAGGAQATVDAARLAVTIGIDVAGARLLMLGFAHRVRLEAERAAEPSAA